MAQATSELSETEKIIIEATIADIQANLKDMKAQTENTGDYNVEIAEDVIRGMTTLAIIL